MPARTTIKSCSLSKFRIWFHPDGFDDKIGFDTGVVTQNGGNPVRLVLVFRNIDAEFERDAHVCKFIRQGSGHLRVHGWQDVIAPLDDAHGKTALPQIFRDFQPDKACTNHHDTFCIGKTGEHLIHIGNGPQRHDPV